MAALLERIAASDQRVWTVAELATKDQPLSDEERVMVAQAVDPNLAAMTPGSVKRRRECGE